MSVDGRTVRNIARLVRIAVTDEDVKRLEGELGVILDWAEQLNEVDTDGVEPMSSIETVNMTLRPDIVCGGGIADEIVANAPQSDDHFFVVPKVVE